MKPCDHCADYTSSACTTFTGADLTILDVNHKLPCNANLNDVIAALDKTLKTLLDGANFTGLDKKCLVFDPATVTAAQLHQLEINEICLLKGRATTLEQRLDTLNIGNEIVDATLGAMTPAGTACSAGTNKYQLKNLLQIIVNKLNNHETRITNLE